MPLLSRLTAEVDVVVANVYHSLVLNLWTTVFYLKTSCPVKHTHLSDRK